MDIKEAIERYKEWEFKCSAYRLVFSTCSFDQATIAPKDGNNYRNERLSYLQGEYYNLATDENMLPVLETLANAKDIDYALQVSAKKQLKEFKELSAIPKDEYIEFSKTRMESEQVWHKAKQEDNYAIFEPYLLKLIEMSQKFAKYCQPDLKPYDYYLDQFEPGMTMEKYDQFFDLVQEKLVPLILKVKDRQEEIDYKKILGDYDIEKQEKFLAAINEYLGFKKNWGYMGISEHPFTDGLSKNDVRVTTAYDKADVCRCIFSVVHEVGHATFEHNVDDKYDGTYIKSSISSGMHESQSRTFENYLARRKSFWVNNYPLLQETFDQFKSIDIDEFIRCINYSAPTLIRTEADELTYPIHILIRYQMEKQIFNHQLDGQPLNQVWKDLYKQYLGIDVPNDTVGILQDIHWSDASFGYFPTYALGSAIGAQIMHTMQQQLDIDDLMSHNHFDVIVTWLHDNIQKDGGLYDFNTILRNATGEEFNPNYYIDYLVDKYSKLYNID